VFRCPWRGVKLNLTAIDRTGASNDWFTTYDAWGDPTKAARTPSGSDVVYTLDALDRQITRTSSGATTTFTYSGVGEALAKAQTGAATPTYYASSPGGPLSQRTGTDPASTRIYLADLHGDLVGLAATSGSNPMKGTALYSPWGVPGTRTGESAILGFQSDMTDPSTGQVDAGVRRYEPVLGRFTTADPLLGDPTDPASLNRYVYGVDAPVSFADPSGLYAAMVSGGGSSHCGRPCEQHVQNVAEQAWEGTSTALDPPFDPGHYATWMNRYASTIRTAAHAFGIPPSVIAGVLATENALDDRNLGRALFEFAASKGCGAPLLGRFCHGQSWLGWLPFLGDRIKRGVSFGAGQIQVRRAELVDSAVRDAVAAEFCDSAACSEFFRQHWGGGEGGLAGRLRNEETNILYVAAYLDRLRATAPEGARWPSVYQTVFDSGVGSYNASSDFAAGFRASRSYFWYLDSA
jgi:RHS repeat-associated protein